MRFLTSSQEERINNFLKSKEYGWYFDFDEGFNSYFFSIFDPNNLKDELLFLVKIGEKIEITAAYRFKVNGKSREVPSSHILYQEALNICRLVEEEFSFL